MKILFPEAAASIKKSWPCYIIESDREITSVRDGKVFTYGVPGYRLVATIDFEPEERK